MNLRSTSRPLWAIALPAMLTNIATALFGIADMWVIGRLGDPAAQGAVELGAKFMLGMLNIFNFLRVSTIALTAHQAGQHQGNGVSPPNSAQTLARAFIVALAIGAVLLLMMPWTIAAGLEFLQATQSLHAPAQTYIQIRYGSAPIWLLNCVLMGWLIGRKRMRWVLGVEITANLLHIGLDMLLVLVLHWGVAGVASATFASEAIKCFLLASIVFRDPTASGVFHAMREPSTWNRQDLTRLFALNRDLFLRTLLLTASLLIFARHGAQAGPVTLAANGILFQLFMLATLLLDGFESAAQVLCAEAKGAQNRSAFQNVVSAALLWGLVTGTLLSTLYLAFGPMLAAGFSTDQTVIDATRQYAVWLALLPILGVTSFVLDGVFVGAGWTRAMLCTMGLAMAVYLCLLSGLESLGNHGLWAAFCSLFAMRALGQIIILRRLTQRTFRPVAEPA